MTSIYTGKIALYNINEIYIIQGRYYEYLFPSLLTIIILNYESFLKNDKVIRIFGIITSLTPLVWYFFFLQNIRLEPWTTSTFQAISTLYPNVFSLSSIKYCYLIIVLEYVILVAIIPKYILKLFLLLITFTWVKGFYLTTSWQYHNRLETAHYAEEGLKIINSIPEENRSKGAIFSEDRYGSVSYTLFSMANNNKVPNDISFENFMAMLNNNDSEIKWLLLSKKLNFDTSNIKNTVDFPHYILITLP
jgi:hypothetical protein